MSNISNSWLLKLSKHSSSKGDLEALRLLPETEALRAWLANQMVQNLLPIQVDNPRWEAHRLRADARLEVLRDLYLLLEKPDV